ncbi:uncharacterized protein VTP21DRAFT_2987 [Calcarisporiella thermophila]|uniref:uncharacterized protein n=1 Tax=Calcarisporiella thermophila TaxID=911321 RepID=UPI00374239CB
MMSARKRGQETGSQNNDSLPAVRVPRLEIGFPHRAVFICRLLGPGGSPVGPRLLHFPRLSSLGGSWFRRQSPPLARRLTSFPALPARPLGRPNAGRLLRRSGETSGCGMSSPLTQGFQTKDDDSVTLVIAECLLVFAGWACASLSSACTDPPPAFPWELGPLSASGK